jgi:hypothetical protein
LIGNSAQTGGGASEAALSNCTLAGNSASYDGGGTYNSTLTDCALSGNSARYGGGANYCTLNNCVLTANSATGDVGGGGGGASGGVLNNCTLRGNSAYLEGGGSWASTLNNCILTGNSASSGGGASFGTLNNCIVYYNTAPHPSFNYFSSTFSYSCTFWPPSGIGNISKAPAFMDTNGWSDLRLQSNSPCINARTNFYAPAGPDLDGNPRIVGGTVDMGAYEHQSPPLLPYYTWLQDYGLSTYSGDLYADSDNDRMNNWQEWRCGTVPTNALSLLRLLMPESIIQDLASLTVTWESVTNRSYFLERGTNLANAELGTGNAEFSLLATNIMGQPGTTSFTDTNAPGSRSLFYPRFFSAGANRLVESGDSFPT